MISAPNMRENNIRKITSEHYDVFVVYYIPMLLFDWIMGQLGGWKKRNPYKIKVPVAHVNP